MFYDIQTGTLHLRDGGEYVELGGGNRPVIRPNLDCYLARDGDGQIVVDYVHDLENRLPFANDSLDGIFSRYMLEHVSWRRLPYLLRECIDSLKAGGWLIAIVPNTEEQIRHLLRTRDWGDGGSMLFGGQDYGSNAHKAFINTELLSQWLGEAGCTLVMTAATGEKGTDMVVMAQKPSPPPSDPVAAPGTMKIRVGPNITMRFPDSWKISPKPDGTGLKTDNPQVTFYAQGDTYWATGPQDPDFIEDADGYFIPAPKESPPAEEVFSRAYFDGGNMGGGYTLYRDFAYNKIFADEVLRVLAQTRNPSPRVIELGGGRGYTMKRLLDHGVTGKCIDISRHCELTHVLPYGTFVRDDAVTWDGWEDECSRDTLIVSFGLLDKLSVEEVDELALQLARFNRGIHAVDTRPKKNDRTRKTVLPVEQWAAKLPIGHTVYDLAKLESRPLPYTEVQPAPTVPTKLNLGSHCMMFRNQWLNVDVVDLSQFASQEGYSFLHHDLRNPLPFATGTVSAVYSSHCLEHLTYEEVRQLLFGVRRVMAEGGAIRLLVPDASYLLDKTLHRRMDDLDELSATIKNAGSHAEKLWAVLMGNHASIYTEELLEQLLEECGFEDVQFPQYASPPLNASELHEMICRETMDCLPEVSLIVTASVPF